MKTAAEAAEHLFALVRIAEEAKELGVYSASLRQAIDEGDVGAVDKIVNEDMPEPFKELVASTVAFVIRFQPESLSRILKELGEVEE